MRGHAITGALLLVAGTLVSGSPDDIGTVAYDISHDGTLIASVEAPPVRIVGLPPATDLSLTVVARDAAGNFSASSPVVECTTLAEGS